MATVDIVDATGTKAGSRDLPAAIFEAPVNVPLMHQVVVAAMAGQRAGTHKAKTRGEVRGGGKKPWRQKGRGTARAGSTRSPLWVGGGTIFGPKPHSYRMKMPAKARQLARKSALSMKAKDEQVMVIEDFVFQEPKTAKMHAILKALSLQDTKTLLLVHEYDRNLWMAGRNIPTLQICEASKASTYDILNNQMLLIQKSALPVIDRTFTKI